MRYIIALWAGMLMSLSIHAQSALNLRFRSEQTASSLYQPAFLMWNDSSRFEFGADLFNRLEANTLSRENIFLSGLNLDEGLKQRIIDDLGADNRLRLGVGGKAIAAYRLPSGLPISLSYGIRQDVAVQVPSTQTVSLAFYGNKRFEGQQLSDQGINGQIANVNEIGLGTAFSLNDLKVGVRLKYLFSSNGIFVDDISYSLLTDTLGSSIDLSGSYDALIADQVGTVGSGAGIDLGLVYEINEKLQLQASLLDFGFISWNGDRLQKEFDIFYEGEEVLDLQAFTEAQELEGVNDLLDQLLPDTIATSQRLATHATWHLGAAYALSPKDHLQLSLLGSLQAQGAGRPTPFINLAYQRSIYQEIFVGLNAFVGGLDGWGIGAMASGNFDLGKSQIQVYGQATNLLGLLAPTSFGGSMVSAGLGYRLVD